LAFLQFWFLYFIFSSRSDVLKDIQVDAETILTQDDSQAPLVVQRTETQPTLNKEVEKEKEKEETEKVAEAEEEESSSVPSLSVEDLVMVAHLEQVHEEEEEEEEEPLATPPLRRAKSNVEAPDAPEADL
jgi:hypothetical protein